MDSDDISIENRFEQQLKLFVSHQELDVVGGDIIEFIDDISNLVGRRSVSILNEKIYENMKIRCPMNHVTVMFRAEAVQLAGGYLDWYFNEDYYLWIRMAQHGAVFENTGTVLVNVRVGRDMYRRRGGNKYFRSEMTLQKYMLSNHLIGWPRFVINVAKRFIVEIFLPNNVRSWFYKKFCRDQNIEL